MQKTALSLAVASAMTLTATAATAENAAFDSTDYLGVQAVSQGDYSGYQVNINARPAPEDGIGFTAKGHYTDVSDDLDITDYGLTAGVGIHHQLADYDSYASFTGGVRHIGAEFQYINQVGTVTTDTNNEIGFMAEAAYEVDFEPVVAGASISQADVGDYDTVSELTVEGRYAVHESVSLSAGYDIATGDFYNDNRVRAGVTFHPDWL